jgi:hypothetical protein
MAVVALFAATARADDHARAEEFFRAGELAYHAQNFATAAYDFDEAYKALPLPEIAFSAAQAYRRQYRIDRKPENAAHAVADYRLYLDKVQTGGRVADAADGLEDMQRELDDLIKRGVKVSDELAAEHTQLDVNVSLGGTPRPVGGMHEIEDKAPASAGAVTVTIDGHPVAPFALSNVTPGNHLVHAEAPGYFPRDQPADAVQGTVRIVEIVLQPKPGRIAVTSLPDARITVDGRAEGLAPRGPIEVPAGRHIVTVQLRGHVPAVRELVVGNDVEVAADAPLGMTDRRRAVPWVAIGAGAAATACIATTALAFYYQHEAGLIYDRTRTSGNVDPTSQIQGAYNDDRNARDSFRAAAWITGGAAIATAGVAVLLYRFDDPEPVTSHVVPVIAPGGGAAVITGRF